MSNKSVKIIILSVFIPIFLFIFSSIFLLFGFPKFILENIALHKTELKYHEQFKVISSDRIPPGLPFAVSHTAVTLKDIKSKKTFYAEVNQFGFNCKDNYAIVQFGDQIKKEIDNSLKKYNKLKVIYTSFGFFNNKKKYITVNDAIKSKHFTVNIKVISKGDNLKSAYKYVYEWLQYTKKLGYNIDIDIYYQQDEYTFLNSFIQNSAILALNDMFNDVRDPFSEEEKRALKACSIKPIWFVDDKHKYYGVESSISSQFIDNTNKYYSFSIKNDYYNTFVQELQKTFGESTTFQKNNLKRYDSNSHVIKGIINDDTERIEKSWLDIQTDDGKVDIHITTNEDNLKTLYILKC